MPSLSVTSASNKPIKIISQPFFETIFISKLMKREWIWMKRKERLGWGKETSTRTTSQPINKSNKTVNQPPDAEG